MPTAQSQVIALSSFPLAPECTADSVGPKASWHIIKQCYRDHRALDGVFNIINLCLEKVNDFLQDNVFSHGENDSLKTQVTIWGMVIKT